MNERATASLGLSSNLSAIAGLTNSAKKKAMKIFIRMDENQDGHLTEEEFLQGCLEDDELSKLLAQGMVE